MKVKKNIKKIGYFWLPSNPNKKLAGILNIKDGGDISIELHGLFGSNPYEEITLWQLDVILCDIEEYGKVTLIDCKYTHGKKSGEGIKFKNNIKCDYAFIGAHFQSKEDLKFKNLIFRVEGLNAWTAISFIDIQHDEQLNPIITNKEIQDIDVKINAFCDLKFIFNLRRTWLPHALGANDHAEIHQDTYLKLLADSNTSFFDFYILMKKLANFFILAIDYQVSIEEITVQQEGLFVECINGKKTDLLQDIKVFTNKTLYKKHYEEIEWPDMMFRYRDIVDFQETINRWLDMYNIIEPSLELYFAVIFSKDNYLKSQFLMLVQALEGLHRRIKKTNVNLEKRLEELFQEFVNLYSHEEIKEYIVSIKDTRHYLSHYYEKEKDKIIDDTDYEININTLILLLKILFLKELGFENEKINEFIKIEILGK